MLHADETPMRLLDPGSGKTRHAYLWAYRSGVHDDGPSIVVFDYQASRAGVHAGAFLHSLRNSLKGHGLTNERKAAQKRARSEHGTL